jgi:hypothetical protein
MKNLIKKIIAVGMVFQILGVGVPQVANAVIISTQQVLEQDERNERIERIDRVFAQDELRKQFVALGVDPDEARLRVASLTDSQLDQIEAGIGAMPAGGESVIWIIGAVFIVLLVLEILGVTNIFTRL